ncbi:ABC transporter permease subunit [Aliivibrio fischeri]|nr:ABC transporter permease subunit [Aliivibrio fischeri]MUK35558.1 ABC transporter permease subunit [Aliivibrio fischeri]
MALAVSINTHHPRIVCFSITRLLLQLCLALFIISVLIAFLPIDPIAQYFNGNVLAVFGEQKTQLIERLGLNQSILEQIMTFGHALFSGDLGYSYHRQEEVSQIIWQRSRYSIILMSSASLLALIFGYSIGLFLGLKPNTILSKIITQLALMINAIPSFWIGLILITIFAIKLVWLPIGGISPIGISPETTSFYDKIPYFILPLTTLILGLIAPIILHTKEKVIDVIQSQHVQYARIHGLSTLSVVRFHLLRNTLIPAIVIQLAGFSELFSGSVIIETVFNFPGIGQTLVQAGLSGDTPLLFGITLCCAVFVFVGNATASLLSRRLSLSTSF